MEVILTRAMETQAFWRFCPCMLSQLASGDAEGAVETLDELEALALHSDSARVRVAAAKAIAHGREVLGMI